MSKNKREKRKLVELKALIDKKGYSVKDVANALSIHPESVRERLSGKVDFYADELVLLSKLLDVSIADLMELIYKK